MILGSEEFVKWVQRKFANKEALCSQLPQKRKLQGDKIKERLVEELVKEFNIEKTNLTQVYHGIKISLMIARNLKFVWGTTIVF